MSDKKILGDISYEKFNRNSEDDFSTNYNKTIGRKMIPDNKIDSMNPDNYKMAILDQSCKKNNGKIVHFKKPRKPLSEHPLNSTFKEDIGELSSKGLMLGGSAIVAKGVYDNLSGAYKPIFAGATLLGAGTLIYKLTDQDIKKYYRNYVSRLEGNYDNLISYVDYAQFVKKYRFKYEEDYYFLNDILAGKQDPIDMNQFMEINRKNLQLNPRNSLGF